MWFQATEETFKSFWPCTWWIPCEFSVSVHFTWQWSYKSCYFCHFQDKCSDLQNARLHNLTDWRKQFSYFRSFYVIYSCSQFWIYFKLWIYFKRYFLSYSPVNSHFPLEKIFWALSIFPEIKGNQRWLVCFCKWLADLRTKSYTKTLHDFIYLQFELVRDASASAYHVDIHQTIILFEQSLFLQFHEFTGLFYCCPTSTIILKSVYESYSPLQ